MDEMVAVEGLVHKAKERKLGKCEFFKKVKEREDSDGLVCGRLLTQGGPGWVGIKATLLEVPPRKRGEVVEESK